MKLKLLFITLTVLSILIIGGCSKRVDIESINNKDNFGDIRAVAWEFINEKGWNDRAKEDWQNAKVNKIVADHKFHLFDKNYQDKEVLCIPFEDNENVVLGTPLILVDPQNKVVIGYLPSE